jgi:hypothetical protein
MISLADCHRRELETDSAILPAVIAERGTFTARNGDDLPATFAALQRRPGLVFPIRDTTGVVVAWQLKADHPRQDKNGKTIKYDTATGGRQCIDVPIRSRPLLANPSVQLWITEGAKKVDSGLSHGIPCIVGLQGVYGWRGTNAHGGKTALPEWESIALNDREVVLAFDSDVMTKATVRDALERLSAFLKQRKSTVRYLLLPALPNGEKCGLDDFFGSGKTYADAERMILDILPETKPGWETPIPLDDPTGPPFPLNALPGIIGMYACAVAEETQTPLDMAASVALGTISAAAGGKYEVVIPEQGWKEPVHIMAVTVAEPGNRKSGVFRLMTKPIVLHERAVQLDERRSLAQWESRLRVLEKQLASTENAASKKDTGHAEQQ